MTTATRKSPRNKRKIYVRNLGDGMELTAEISPCVFTDQPYPLQLTVTLRGPTGDPRGEAYASDGSKNASTYTDASVRRLLATVQISSCRHCSAAAFDPATAKTNRDGLCEACFLARSEAEWAADGKADRRKIDRRDRRMKRDGMAVRVTAWVHPEAGGDDYQVDWYLDVHPTPEDVRSLLRNERSSILDDYQIFTL